jgi:hypothetical protein
MMGISVRVLSKRFAPIMARELMNARFWSAVGTSPHAVLTGGCTCFLVNVRSMYVGESFSARMDLGGRWVDGQLLMLVKGVSERCRNRPSTKRRTRQRDSGRWTQ